ncbi:hypothetical protein P376_4149 [Streptomyces sp. HCCB10043]|nr:hypothetical protein P376_4149 [Streptomyces sp. HCCB10043]
MGAVGGPRQAQGQGRGGLRLQGQIRQDVAHQRLVDQLDAEHRTVACVMGRLRERGTDPGGGPEHTVEPGHRHHVDDRAHALALVPDEPGHGVVELRLAGRVGPVAELLLEPLDAEGVPAPVRQHARHQEARQTPGRLGEHQEEVVHRRTREPLVAAQPPGAVGLLHGGRGVGTHIGAALLLRHPHPGEQTALGGGRAQPGLVHPAGEQRLVRLREVGGAAQRRDDGVRHRDRAQVPLLQHRGQHEAAGPGDMGPGPLVGPGGARQPRPHRGVHQRVIGRVELDLVDPVAETVVGAQLRLMPIGLVGPVLRLLAADVAAETVQLVDVPLRALAAYPFEQHRVVGGVVPGERWGLVGHLVRHGGRVAAWCGGRGHRISSGKRDGGAGPTEYMDGRGADRLRGPRRRSAGPRRSGRRSAGPRPVRPRCSVDGRGPRRWRR